MNKALLSLCLFGAALATANILIMQRPTCSSTGTEVAVADKDASSPQTEAISMAKGKPAQAPKAAAKKPAPAPKDVQVTGSVNQTDKTQRPDDKKPAPVSQAQLAEVSAGPAKVEDEPEEWAEVSLAAKVHSAPSVSAPTVRYYRVGTRLKVVGREPGWIKVVDPTTSKEGWIYEKYLTPKEGPDQKQVGTPQSKMPDDMNVSAPAQPEPYAGSYRPRSHGWRWHRARRPAMGFAFRIYPRW